MNDTITTQTFKLSTGDYCRFYFVTFYRLYRHPLALLFLLFICLGCPGMIAYTPLTHGAYGIFFAYVMTFSIMWLGVFPLLGLISFLSYLRKSRNVAAPRVAELSPGGFAEIGEQFESRQQWGLFREVGETGRIIYLLTTARSGMIVRKDAFTSDSDRKTFIVAAKQHIAAARHKHSAVFYDEAMPEVLREGWTSPPFALTFSSFFPYYTRVLYKAFTRPGSLIILASIMIGVPVWLNRNEIVSVNCRHLRP